ncbi:MAG: O-antigen ligase family protein [Puniceicoccales bacterium]
MWEEEYPLPGYQSVTERFVTWQFLGLGIISTWLFAGDVTGGYAVCAAISAITIFFYFFLGREPVIPGSERQAYLLQWSLLPFALFIIWVIGQFSPAIRPMYIGDTVYLQFDPPPHPWPITGLPWSQIIYALYVSTLQLASIGIVAVVVSRHAVARVLWLLFLNAIVLALVGGITTIMRWEKILATFTPAQPDFFSMFPSGHQWAAFGLFWVVVGFGMLFHIKRRGNWRSLLENKGIWLIGGWLLIIWSVYETGAPVHRFLLGVALGLMSLRVGTALIRHLRTGVFSVLLGALFSLAGLALTASAAIYFVNELFAAQTDETLMPFGVPLAVHEALWRDAWSLFMERPLFGWGAGSFSEVFVFHQQVDLGNAIYSSPQSDLLRGLVEHGAAGVLLWLAFPVSLAFAFARLKTRGALSHYLWAGATLLALLGVVTQPFMSPANMVCFFMALPMAYKWSEAPKTGTGLFKPRKPKQRKNHHA